MKIKFSNADEFLAELTKECESSSGPYAIDDQIIRLTYSYQQSKDVPFLYSISVIAGYVVRGKLIELNQLCGEVIQAEPSHEGSLRVKAQGAIILANIEATARELNLAVRAGMFEP